jgi:hypothetical protein
MPLRFFAIIDSVIGAVLAVLVTSPGRLFPAVGRGANDDALRRDSPSRDDSSSGATPMDETEILKLREHARTTQEAFQSEARLLERSGPEERKQREQRYVQLRKEKDQAQTELDQDNQDAAA